MAGLIALDVPPGEVFVDSLRRAWDRGEAVLPIDQRLPIAARRDLMTALGASAVVGPDGQCSAIDGGVPTEPGDALVVATSGTTGTPKGVVLTHDAVGAHARAVNQRLAVDPATDRWLACLPLAHVGGLGVVMRAILTDTPLEVLPAFDAAAIADAARRGATLTSLVPTALDRIDPELFRWVVLGGSGDSVTRPDNVVRTYGMTESCGGVVYGSTPLEGVEVRVIADEIQLRSPTLLRSYRDGTDPRTPDGWYPTGDLGSIDAAGALRVSGRRSDLIITGGENVWPGAVEEVLRGLDGVADVAVIGKPDPEWGQRVVAVVEAVPGAQLPTLDAVRDRAKERLPAFAAPRELVLVAQLPRTAIGKIRRDRL